MELGPQWRMEMVDAFARTAEGGRMTEQQELALYRVVFSLPHHQRRLALARKIIEQGGPLTPDYKEYRTSLRLCNQMLDDPRLSEVLGKG